MQGKNSFFYFFISKLRFNFGFDLKKYETQHSQAQDLLKYYDNTKIKFNFPL